MDAAAIAMEEAARFRAALASQSAAPPAKRARPAHMRGLSLSPSGSSPEAVGDTPERALAALCAPGAVEELAKPPLLAEEPAVPAPQLEAVQLYPPSPDQLPVAAEEEEEAPVLDMRASCRSVECFERLNHIDEGTYGVVFRARCRESGRVVALKKVKMEKEREGFPLTSLREMNLLLGLRHEAVVRVWEVVVGASLDSVFMVMEYMEHDLRALLDARGAGFPPSEAKCLFRQALAGVAYLHAHWVLHRDLKTSNILVDNRGQLKLCDFGMARQYGSPLRPYTHMVVTLWYRAPELLLGDERSTYSTGVDTWALGCVLGELLGREPLLAGRSEIEQLDKMVKLLGTPSAAVWPGFDALPVVRKIKLPHQPYNHLRNAFPARGPGGAPGLSDAGFALLNGLLTYDPAARLSAAEALEHTWFSEVPLPKEKALMPTRPAKSGGKG